MARDINRIYPFCNQLAALWSQHPDLRFGQLITALSSYTDIEKRLDIFYIEDDKLMQIITEYMEVLK